MLYSCFMQYAAPNKDNRCISISRRQEEFNRRLKAKRAVFSNKRSLSLASFKISVPSSVVPPLLKKGRNFLRYDVGKNSVLNPSPLPLALSVQVHSTFLSMLMSALRETPSTVVADADII